MKSQAEELVSFCSKYLEVFAKELESTKVNHDINPIFITSLWLRIIENFEGIIALVKANVPINGFVLLRSMTEAYVIMKKAIQDEEFFKVYQNKFVKEKVSRLKSIGPVKDQTGFTMSEAEIQELKEHFESQIQAGVNKSFSAKHLFYDSDVNEVSLYEMVYAHCNIYTHCDAGSLDVYVEVNEGRYSLVRNNKILEHSVLVSLMSAKVYALAFELFAKYVNHEIKSKDSYIKEYNELHDKFAEILDRGKDKGSQT